MKNSFWTNDDFAAKRRGSNYRLGSLKERHFRVYGLVFFAFIWAGIVIARLYSLQISNYETWQEWALKQHFSEVTVASERGPILDRNNKLLAVSVPSGSVYVRPKQIKDKKQVVSELSKVLEMEEEEILRKLDQKSPFIWLKRQIPGVHAEAVQKLKLQGVGVVTESKRYYPYNQSASTLIGYVGVDGNGLSGIEAMHEKYLHADHLKAKVHRDALGNFIESSASSESDYLDLPKGNALRLTLDSEIQAIVDNEIDLGRKEANAKRAMAVMIDADTGDVLAMGQSPSPNFNQPQAKNSESRKNAIAETVFEPGSIMKPLVAAAVMDLGLANPSEIFDCEGGKYKFAKHTIKDVHPYGALSLRDIIVRSSNIGMTKLGVRIGADRLYDALRSFGFGDKSSLGIQGETRGILRPVSSWAAVDVATHSFGQGIAVTPLQVVRAVSSIVNGGRVPKLRLVDDGLPPEMGERVLSRKTADQVKEMMFAVVEDEHGTGGNAVVPGVRIGGKTGTAQKAKENGRGYAEGLYVASFVGFVEAQTLGVKRRMTLLVMVDEPKTKSIYGGTLAAPVFQKIIKRTLKMLTTHSNESIQESPDNFEEINTRSPLTQVAFIP